MISATDLRETEREREEFLNIETQSLEKNLLDAHNMGLRNFILSGRIAGAQIEIFRSLGYEVKEAAIYSCGRIRFNTILSW